MNPIRRTYRTGSLAAVAGVFLALALAIAVIFFWGVFRQQLQVPPANEPTPNATPVTNRLAPLGVRYLTKRATITSATGVTGIPAGAEVKVVKEEKDGKILVEFEGNKLLLPASQLTRDLDLVDSLTNAAGPNSPPGSPQQKISCSEPEQESALPVPAQKSFVENITGRISLWWQNFLDWINPPPPPPPTAATRVKQNYEQLQQRQTQEKIEHADTFNKSKRQWIAFHERAICDLEKQMIGRKDASGIRAIQREIAERRILIAKIKAEIEK